MAHGGSKSCGMVAMGVSNEYGGKIFHMQGEFFQTGFDAAQRDARINQKVGVTAREQQRISR